MKKTLGFLLLSTTIVVLIPPQSWYIIAIFIITIGLLSYSVLQFFVRKSFSALIAFFLMLSLALLALKLFDPINILLVISLFVGLLILIR